MLVVIMFMYMYALCMFMYVCIMFVIHNYGSVVIVWLTNIYNYMLYSLYCNQIGPEGAVAVAGALEKNTFLSILK